MAEKLVLHYFINFSRYQFSDESSIRLEADNGNNRRNIATSKKISSPFVTAIYNAMISFLVFFD